MSPRIAALLVMLGAALILVAGAGAGSQPPKINLKDPTAVNSYLQSIGVDPAKLVRQTGLNNYAGPNCPGVGWNCTTSLIALQLATPGGQNKFECAPEDAQVIPPTGEDTNTCVIMQEGDNNNARCKMKDTTDTETQRCVVTQDGKTNMAVIDELIVQTTGPTQAATQTASVTQTATDKNASQIHQAVKQSTNLGTEQSQVVHQAAVVSQTAGSSDNFAHVHQDQDLSETGAATLQEQNILPLPADVPDCDQEHKPNNDPNACAHVEQTSNGGKNETHLHQNISEVQKTSADGSTQTQERFLPTAPGSGGIEADIDQTNPLGAGTNRKIVHQDARERQEGGTTQNQVIDPNCCGVGTTIGGVDNLDDIHQKAMQSASSGAAAFQLLGLVGDTNQVSGGGGSLRTLSTAGAPTCRFHQDGSNNEFSTNFTLTVDPCIGVNGVATHCTNTEAPGDGEAGCTTFPVECFECTASALQSSPTFGQPIAPPDFGEPSDFPGPYLPGL
jgi:hypothetical protein